MEGAALRKALFDAAATLEVTGFVDWAKLERVAPSQTGSRPSKTRQSETTGSGSRDLPELAYPPVNEPTFNLKVGTILDPFSARAFGYEWHSIPLGRTTWRDQLSDCDLLFIESAWAGNNGEWKHCLTGTSGVSSDFVDLLEDAKGRGIPTVFWNKEDPPHYDDFLEAAKLFDVVFTSDSNRVPNYIRDLGHSNVGVLAFAAQPRIHNPVRVKGVKRDREVCFGGMYFAHKYPERRAQMDYLLPAASSFKFDIFSRFYKIADRYRFPEPYNKHVRGELSYDQMLVAYRAYKVFLNVNSVTDSPSMCARRIFEILASGGAVVSAPSPAIPNYFPQDLVPTPGDEESARSVLRGLLRQGGYRERQVHKAQRVIWQSHTYSHRVRQITSAVGTEAVLPAKTVTVIAPTIRPDQVQNILENVGRQKDVAIQLLLTTHGFRLSVPDLKKKAAELGIEDVQVIEADRTDSLGTNLNRMVLAADGEIVSKFDDDDYYGPHYMYDLLAAKAFSSADVVGKAATYVYFEARETLVLTYEADEHRFVDFVRGPTLTADKDVFIDNPFPDATVGEDSTFLRRVKSSGGRIYAADKYNFYLHRSANVSSHTWQASEDKLFSSGHVASFGPPKEYVTV
ncbi:glycosyltransferase [Nesterenkonia massiliensis]|uniref:Glycosyltransferase n=1 Tax=Nesterenkonia massiliensis TaxID=1232429 RepID=A0ABT2HMJ7_9MICC|nr:glycosyltransferase [Nesterenkonia massiliensis]